MTPVTQSPQTRTATGLVCLVAAAIVALHAMGSGAIHAQEFDGSTLGDDIPIAVALHPDLASQPDAVQSHLHSRLTSLVSRSGLAAVPGISDFVLYPTLVTLDEGVAGGGLRDQVVVRAEISLFVKNAADGRLFASDSWTFTGSGASAERAMMDVISSLRPRDRNVRDFLTTTRERIVGYYDSNCDAVVAEGSAAAATGDVGRAIAVLMAVPAVSSCHERSSNEAAALVAAQQERECGQALVGARAEVAADRFGAAIDLLATVDPSSPCASDAEGLIDDIDDQVRQKSEAQLTKKYDSFKQERTRVNDQVAATGGVRTRRLEIAGGIAAGVLNSRRARAFDPSIFNPIG